MTLIDVSVVSKEAPPDAAVEGWRRPGPETSASATAGVVESGNCPVGTPVSGRRS
jgi:hypothetical protein